MPPLDQERKDFQEGQIAGTKCAYSSVRKLAQSLSTFHSFDPNSLGEIDLLWLGSGTPESCTSCPEARPTKIMFLCGSSVRRWALSTRVHSKLWITLACVCLIGQTAFFQQEADAATSLSAGQLVSRRLSRGLFPSKPGRSTELNAGQEII
ncbi:hypothetical protein VTO42DRAFT_7410 [Malbranchea cinnamomea]